ncbi:M23 family metallopeptidase [Arthrobacter sp. YD2]|uniref:M23 family metallopeptidase n=1 Tax=Arthrobacter sp. YD2 TaxID=3058046 RepID=UPI0025B4AC5B|nr:M23 family metallopeptidase [Arthrobacter sp. YD2]MDN3905161.1 M23 family metallopeptidase [Arthrobacter sp. YD2]
MRIFPSLPLVALLLVAVLLPAPPEPAPAVPVSTGRVGGARFAAPWSWPLSPDPAPIRYFDKPAQPWLAGHRGVDLAATPAAPVLAPADGYVVFAGVVVNRPVLTIDHGSGLKSSFESVTASVGTGTFVARGTEVGTVASSPEVHCSGNCLHWGVRLEKEYVNPLDYVLDRRPSVLLPGGNSAAVGRGPLFRIPRFRF